MSTGLDGLPFAPYHFGSHWLFAGISNLLHVRVIDFYNRGYAVVFVPFGVFSLATLATRPLDAAAVRPRKRLAFGRRAGTRTRRADCHIDQPLRPIGPLFWFVMSAGYIGFLPYAAGVMPASGWNVNIVSESYGLAVAVSLLAIGRCLAIFPWCCLEPTRIFRGRCRDCRVGGLGRTHRVAEDLRHDGLGGGRVVFDRSAASLPAGLGDRPAHRLRRSPSVACCV